MKVKKLKLNNFRCFGPGETVISFEDLTTFVGLNSSGKTAVLHALLKLFGQSPSARQFARADFHVKKGERPENITERSLYLEAIIVFPETGEGSGETMSAVPPFFRGMVIDKPEGDLYVRMRLEATWQRGNTPNGITDTRYFFVTAPEDPETEDSADHRKPVTSGHLANIRTVYVPAIRDPLSELRSASGSILWNVWRGINWPENIDESLSSIGQQVEKTLSGVGGFKTLRQVMEEQWTDYHTDARYNNIALQFDSVDLEAVLSKLDVRFSPTVELRSYDIDDLGEGLRSLFYLSLVNSMLELEALAAKEATDADSASGQAEDGNDVRIFSPSFIAPALTVLAVEEPENHLAPHLLGRIMDTLHNIAGKANAQVVVTSHTPAILRRVEPESVRHLRMCKDRLCSVANSIRLPEADDDAYKYIKKAVRAYPELYFARFVVLGEGDTEEVVVPRALELQEKPTLDGSGISVVPLGGRHVNHFWKLLRQLDIPHVTLLDLDLGRKTGGWARIKYVVKQLINDGIKRQDLFDALNEVLDGFDIVLSAESLEELHNRSDNREAIEATLDVFEDYDVFFAAPLDLTDVYQSTTEDRGGYGPRVPEQEEELEERARRAAQTALKTCEDSLDLYSKEEQELMIWYNYLFMNRGKPSTHFLALSQISDEDFGRHLPIAIGSLIRAADEYLADDPLSQSSED
jgi:putative ATP-dependent endonuclease of OLD family